MKAVNELLEWLLTQKGGVGTYYEFQRKVLTLRNRDTENAALARLLADLAGRFAEAYDGQPLSVSLANEALGRLTAFVETAVRTKNASLAERLALLNEIGRADLA